MTRLAIGLGLVVACLALLCGWLIFKDNPWKPKAVAARQEAAVATETGRVIERTFTNERTIYKQSETAAHAIESLPSGGDRLPDDIRGGWLAGLRDNAPASTGEPARQPPN